MVAVSVPILVLIFFCGNAVYFKVAACISVKSSDYVEKRGLSAAGLTEHGDEFAFAEVYVYSAQSFDHRISDVVFFSYFFQRKQKISPQYHLIKILYHSIINRL